MKTRRMASAVTALGLSLGLFASPAMAQTKPARPNIAVPDYVWKVTSAPYTGTWTQYWSICAHVKASPVTQHITCYTAQSYTTATSGTISASAYDVTSAIGYQESYTYTVAASDIIDIPANRSGDAEWGPNDRHNTVNQREEVCVSGTCNWMNNYATGYTKKYVSPSFGFVFTN